MYLTEDPDKLVLEFRNEKTAFDGEKVEQLARKGMVNNAVNHFIMGKLQDASIPTQEALLSDNESLVKKLEMIPVGGGGEFNRKTSGRGRG